MTSGTETEWVFAPRHKLATQRDPVYEEFFTGGEAVDAPSALIREAVQNSLDAVQDRTRPVQVSILTTTGGEGLSASIAQKYFAMLPDHVAASGIPGVTKQIFDHECPFVVYEDFNTTGLTGDPDAFEAPPAGSKNNFYYFFRAEGRSGKSDAERGRWGVGKYVFPMSSEINTFFAYSVCEGGSESHGSVLGKSILRNHVVGADGYQPDGWWATIREEDDAPLPISKRDPLEMFRTDWRAVRKAGQPGTSIVIPYVRQDIDFGSLAEAVAAEYHLAILTGRLEVQIARPDQDVLLQASDIVAKAPTLISDTTHAERVAADLALLKWHVAQPPRKPDLSFPGGSAPKWSEADVDPEVLDGLKTQLETEGRVAVIVPVHVQRVGGGSSAEGHVTVLLEARPGYVGPPAFYREGILLTKEQESTRLNGVRAIVLIDESAVGGMFGDAENPAHTKWSHTTAKFKGKYVHGWSWLTIVRNAPPQLLKLLQGQMSEPDLDLAHDFFSVDVSGDGSQGPGTPGGSGGTPPPTPPPTRRAEPTIISGSKGEVKIRLSDAGKSDGVKSLTGTVAYDTRRGNPFTKYRREDFDLADLLERVAGGGSTSRGGKQFTVNVTDADSFVYELSGFDANRDLIVKVEVEREND